MRTSSLIGFSLLLVASNAFAQLTVTSLTEMQRGEVPGSDSTAISTVYEQFNVDYSQKDLQVGIRAEVYNAWGADRQITQITQKYARWSHGSAYIVAGTYYAMLGRGLTLRAFELPGVVLESSLYRLRYTPSQDLEGGMATWTGDKLEFKALVGRPAESDVPPGAKRGNPPETIPRREDWVAGSELSLRPFQPIKVGGTFVHINPSNQALDNHQAWSALSEIDLTPLLDRTGERGIYGSFYGEYAERFALGEDGPGGHGLYLSGNIGGGRLGLSAEYKNYANFTLGFNDPPSLIREHATFLLNKATHALLSLNESGYQFETTYTQPDFATFTGNIAYAKNELSATVVKTYKERYLAVDLEKFAPAFLATAYFDWGEDGIAGIEKRRIGGITLETTPWTDHSLGFEFQISGPNASSAPRPISGTPTAWSPGNTQKALGPPWSWTTPPIRLR